VPIRYETFNGTLPRKLLSREQFDTLLIRTADSVDENELISDVFGTLIFMQ
jgi:hypothetical protein